MPGFGDVTQLANSQAVMLGRDIVGLSRDLVPVARDLGKWLDQTGKWLVTEAQKASAPDFYTGEIGTLVQGNIIATWLGDADDEAQLRFCGHNQVARLGQPVQQREVRVPAVGRRPLRVPMVLDVANSGGGRASARMVVRTSPEGPPLVDYAMSADDGLWRGKHHIVVLWTTLVPGRG